MVGIIVACFTARFDSVGFVLLGAWLGATSTIFLANIYARCAFAAFVVYKMWKKNIRMGLLVGAGLIVVPILYLYTFNTVTFWLCMGAITVVCAFAAYAIKDLLVTVATSILGAYLSVRGLSLILGGFPDEYDTFMKLKNGDYNVECCYIEYPKIGDGDSDELRGTDHGGGLRICVSAGVSGEGRRPGGQV